MQKTEFLTLGRGDEFGALDGFDWCRKHFEMLVPHDLHDPSPNPSCEVTMYPYVRPYVRLAYCRIPQTLLYLIDTTYVDNYYFTSIYHHVQVGNISSKSCGHCGYIVDASMCGALYRHRTVQT